MNTINQEFRLLAERVVSASDEETLLRELAYANDRFTNEADSKRERDHSKVAARKLRKLACWFAEQRNARSAAAPELLEALKGYHDGCVVCGDDRQCFTGRLISKAEGKS